MTGADNSTYSYDAMYARPLLQAAPSISTANPALPAASLRTLEHTARGHQIEKRINSLGALELEATEPTYDALGSLIDAAAFYSAQWSSELQLEGLTRLVGRHGVGGVLELSEVTRRFVYSGLNLDEMQHE